MKIIEKFFKKKINIVILGFLFLILYINININSNKGYRENFQTQNNIYCGVGNSSIACGSNTYPEIVGTCSWAYTPPNCTDLSCNDLLSRCVDKSIPDINTPSSNVATQSITSTCTNIQGAIVRNANAATYAGCENTSNS
tara:strand:- start:659 stop:1078 length:420 start_codon:yes stop_codon:yes gene_type:complete